MGRTGGFLRNIRARESLSADDRCDHDFATWPADRSHLPATPLPGPRESDSPPTPSPSPAARPAAGPGPQSRPQARSQVSAPSLDPKSRPQSRSTRRPAACGRIVSVRSTHAQASEHRALPPGSAPAGRPAAADRRGYRGSLASAGHLGHSRPARHPPATSAIVDRQGTDRPPRPSWTSPASAGHLGYRRPARHSPVTSVTADRPGTRRPPRPP